MAHAQVITVIPHWNLKKDLAECLDSLQRIAYPAHQVVVVDNASTDGSVEFLREQYPWVHMIGLPQNGGFAVALNAGIAFALNAGAAYVFALNNDTVVRPDVLARLVALMDAEPSIGVVAPKVLYYDHPELIYRLGDRMYRWLPLPIGFGTKWRDHPRYTGVMEFDYVSGCAMLIRATLFHEIGLFDPTYFMYYEDADFCRRVRAHRYRIVCLGDAVLYHKTSLSAKKDPALICRIRARNRVRFYRRFPHGPHPWLTYLALTLIAIWRLVADVIRGRRDLLKPYLLGLRDGWREVV